MMGKNGCLLPTLLSCYADNELSNREKAQVEHHITECPRCAAVLEEYRVISNLLTVPPVVEPAPGLWNRIRQQLADSEPEPRRKVFIRWRPAILSAAAALVLVGALFTARQLQQTIDITSHQAIIESVNLPPEDANAPVLQEAAPGDTFDEDTTGYQE